MARTWGAAGGGTGATGGAKLDAWLGSTCAWGADIDVSHEIPEFIGNTSGMGA